MKLLLSILWPTFKSKKYSFLLSLFFLFITISSGIFLLYTSGWLLTASALFSFGMSFNLFVPSALIRASSIVKVISRYLEKINGHNSILYLLSDLRISLFDKLIHLGPKDLSKYRNGDLLSRMVNDIDMLDTVFLLFLEPLLVTIILTILLVGLLSIFMPLGIIIFVPFVIISILFVPYLVVFFSRKLGQRNQEISSEIRESILETIRSHSDIFIFNMFNNKRQEFDYLCSTFSSSKKKYSIISITANYFVSILFGFLIVCMLIIVFTHVDHVYIDFPIAVGFLLSIFAFFEIINSVVRGSGRLGIAMSSAERINLIMTSNPSIVDIRNPVCLPLCGDILVSNVSFSYDLLEAERNNFIIKDLNLKIKKGEKIAIIGTSGVGKSTFLSLLLRLEDPLLGSISFGGVDIRSCAQADLHRRIVLLSQDSPVFMGSIRSNLLIGNSEASDDDLWNSLSRVRLKEFVSSLPEGLNTWVGENGSNMSVGQVRRLCMARSLLSNSSVLVFDEPTSGLNYELEQDFFEDLKYIDKDERKSIVLVTHADIPDGIFNNIYRLSKGKLIKL